MSKDKKFNDILDECLERLLVRGETLEDCLNSFPRQAAELKPLLKTAAMAKKALDIQPRSQFKAAAGARLHATLEEEKRRKARPFFAWQPRWAMVMTSLVLALLLTGGSLAALAGGSMPGESLYPVKLAVEQVLLTLSTSPLAKAKMFAELADKRVTEIIYLAQRGEVRQVEEVTRRLDTHLKMITSLMAPGSVETDGVSAPLLGVESAPKAPLFEIDSELTANESDYYSRTGGQTELGILLSNYAFEHPAALTQTLEIAPESVQAALYRAIAVAVAGYQNALGAIEETETQ